MLKVSKGKPYFLLIPCVLYLAFIIIIGLGVGLLQSLGVFSAMGMSDITLDYYKKVLTSTKFYTSLKFSLYTSFVSSVLAVFLGTLISIVILELKNKGKNFTRIFRVPISVPHIVVVLIMITLLGKTGLLARFTILFFPNMDVSFFSNIIFDKGGVGIILVYLWKEIPFVALTTHAVLANIDDELKYTALNLGASYFQVIRFIFLPLAVPTIFYSFIVIFAFSFGAYEVPMLIGPTVPKTLPVQAFIEYTSPLLENRPYALAYTMLILFFSLLMLLLFFSAYKIIFQNENKGMKK